MLKIEKQYNAFLLIVLTWLTITPPCAAKVLTLKDCIDILKEKNIDIKISQLCLSRDLPKIRLKYPLLDFTLNVSQPMDILLYAHEDGHALQAGSGSMDLVYSLRFEAIRQYKWNKRLSKKDELINKLQKLQDIEHILIKAIAAYYDLAKSQKEYEYRLTSAKVAKLAVEEKTEKYKIGKVSEIDLIECKMLLQGEELKSLNAEQNLKKHKRALNLILDQPIDANITVDTAVQEQLNWLSVKEKISQSKDDKKDSPKGVSFEKNLDMAIKELQIQRNILSLKSAKSSIFDCLQMDIVSHYKVPFGLYDIGKNRFIPVSTQLNNMKNGQQKMIKIGLVLKFNITDLFQSMPRDIRIAKLQIEKDKLEKIKHEAELKNQEADMRSAYVGRQAMYKLQQERVKYMRQKVALQQAMYSVQKCTLLELLKVKNELNANELKLIEYDFDVHLSKFALDAQMA